MAYYISTSLSKHTLEHIPLKKPASHIKTRSKDLILFGTFANQIVFLQVPKH